MKRLKTYKIIIKETVSQTFDVQANNENEAIKIAQDKYKSCDFVLEPGHLICKQIAIDSSNCQDIKYFEF